MGQVSKEVKDAIIGKAFNRGTTSLRQIARDNNIGVSTLHKWLQRYCEKKGVTPLSVVLSHLFWLDLVICKMSCFRRTKPLGLQNC